MARVTHVKRAQRRFATVPVIDPETGEQKKVPVMSKRTGLQKVNKHDRPVFRRLTVEDRSQPLPSRTCDKCRSEIGVGQPYKWISPRSGPYGGTKRFRCGTCPSWHVWEYSSSLSARLAEISYHFFLALLDAEDPDAVQAALEDAAQGARDLAEEKRESASNIEDGFGHPTSMSEELEEIANNLDGWADEIESVEVPDLPEPEPEECDECEGSGEDEIACYTCDGTGEVEDDDGKEAICYVCNGFGVDEIACYNCDGTGEVESNEVSEDQMGDWVAEVESACSIVDESPV